MTIDLLENYRTIASNINAIETEIATLYTPISSPNGKEMSGSFNGSPSDPTANAAMRIIEMREQMAQERERMYALLEEIEEWLRSCPDTEIVSIIRWYYLLGLTWKQTNVKVFGYPDYQYSRKKVMRYFHREK